MFFFFFLFFQLDTCAFGSDGGMNHSVELLPLDDRVPIFHESASVYVQTGHANTALEALDDSRAVIKYVQNASGRILFNTLTCMFA